MRQLVDIHHHLIFGVDDGAQTRDEMFKMLLKANNEGVGHVVATPHIVPDAEPVPRQMLQERVDECNAWCVENGLSLTVYPGAEVFCSDMTISMLRADGVPTLSERKCVLLEFGTNVSCDELKNAAMLLGTKGYHAVFAHIERYRCLRKLENLRILREEYEVLMQMNASTVLENHGFFSNRWVDRVLREGMVDVIASDAHNTTTRPCRMKACYEHLAKRYGESRAYELCAATPGRLIGL